MRSFCLSLLHRWILCFSKIHEQIWAGAPSRVIESCVQRRHILKSKTGGGGIDQTYFCFPDIDRYVSIFNKALLD